MNFTIKQIEKKVSTKTGKPYAVATMTNEAGTSYENVTIFDSASKEVGTVINGELAPNDFNGKKGWRFVEARPNAFPKKENNISKAIETKNSNIAMAQERKHDAVKLAGTARDATLLTVAMINQMPKINNPSAVSSGPSVSSVKEMWQEWRAWLLTEFDQQPPF